MTVSDSGQPVTDAFGTRLLPSDLVAGLDACGLSTSKLILLDSEVVLECPDPDIRRDDVARALTWLRSRISPLVSMRAALLESGSGDRFIDQRTRPTHIVFLAEEMNPRSGLDAMVDDVLGRLALGELAHVPGSVTTPGMEYGFRDSLATQLASLLNAKLPSPSEATISVLVPAVNGSQPLSPPLGSPGPHFLIWFRPENDQGVHKAVLIAASKSASALGWFAHAVCGDERLLPSEILLDGLAWKAARRPTIARTGGPELSYDAIEEDATDTLRPTQGADTSTLASSLAHRPGWLSRLSGLPGPSFPATFPPSYFRARPETQRPKYILGLAVMTMQEHAAVLLRDGEVVGAIEHEKLVRIRHAGWHPPGRPGVTAAMDPTISLEETFCRRPIRALLEKEGVTLDDIDLFAVNGLHGRYADRISFIDASVPVPAVRAGRVVYLPHHLCHAASAWRASGFASSWVLTVDGRGDRECASVWRAESGELKLVDTLLSLTDRSIGGVYEGVTRLLGFGGHGQGSIMALGAFGAPTRDFGRFLPIRPDGSDIHESGIDNEFADLRRSPEQPLERRHQDLAASLQLALENSVIELLRRNAGPERLDALCLAGGVALNCRMNERLRQTFAPKEMFVQPAANDAGTALGAALEAWAQSGGSSVAPMSHSYLGPEFSDAEIEPVLRRSGLRYIRAENIAKETADRLARGDVVCWFQGRMEFGPRALGARSIVADPRRKDMHARVNAIKQREPWRPFGPSILSGHEQDWIENAFDARFMLFTLPVKPDRRESIPAVVHVDGTTRPQVVHAETAPLYHAMISEFHRLSGVPLVLNTSFNRRGEPIVCTPSDAIHSFRGLGADALAIGNFLVTSETAVPAARPSTVSLAALPGGRRLSMRLTTKCDLDCGHCSMRDLAGKPDRTFDEALQSLTEGREAGCDELVLLRGEAALRVDLPTIINAARRMGYRFVQLQTNANALANPQLRSRLLAAGVDSFEVMVVAAEESLHDRLTGKPGSFRALLPAIAALVQSKKQLLITVPVLAGNLRQLRAIAALSHKLGVTRIQFAFPRPVELPDRVVTDHVPRLALASRFLELAVASARKLGLTVTTEAFPLCHLPPELRESTDAAQDWSRHRVDDLHILHESVGDVRPTQRPEPPPCRSCPARDRCPKTWALYLELFGSDELKPLSA